MKDQKMKKIRSALALAGLFALVAVRSNALVLNENFTNDPALDGWQTFGDTSLFQWDSANQVLDVTWDSSQQNSYFYHPLGTTFSKTNDFVITFDFSLNDINIGTDPGDPDTFEIAIGLINTGEATSGNYFRGSGYFPDIAEFDYFPNDINDYGATISTLFISSEDNYSGGGFTDPLELETGTRYHVVMVYTATNEVLHTTMTANGAPIGPIVDSYLGPAFDDYQVDAISISSYNDAGQYPGYAGSILAHGTVNKLACATPLPVYGIQTPAAGQVDFTGTTNWIYTLERSLDFQTWQTVSLPAVAVSGNTPLTLYDTNPPPVTAFYRIRSDLP
ncbi:MAG TPA: hypothetical protein VGI03_07305 [Verrucomicrobiae bacterium]|jgi:hypothetical protein